MKRGSGRDGDGEMVRWLERWNAKRGRGREWWRVVVGAEGKR